MIKKLEQLTMAQFIDLCCGDTSVLYGRHEVVSSAKAAHALRGILHEYRMIVDPAEAKSYIRKSEELAKAKMSQTVFRICRNLVNLRELDRVRDILNAYGINTERMSDQRVEAEVRSRLNRAIRSVEELENDREKTGDEPMDIRATFDAQTAALMAHFKFQIDMTTMKATIYAQLVARFNREVSAQMAAMKKK